MMPFLWHLLENLKKIIIINMLNILADDKIPLVNELFASFGKVVQKSGAAIRQQDLLNVDVLLTRTVTKVGPTLLKGTAVKYVGSATAGQDHLDTEWLDNVGIAWANAPGVNATAVAQYVMSCVAYLRKQHKLPEKNWRVGIVGAGHAGSAVAEQLAKRGAEVLLNDPPRAARDSNFHSVPLDDMATADLICLHASLTHKGPFPSFHLINSPFLSKLNPGCVLLNAGRGALIDTEALLQHKEMITCLDVWENEPNINIELLKQAFLATPHIAGYTKQAKYRATYHIYEKFLQAFELNDKAHSEILTKLNTNHKVIIADGKAWEDAVLKIYDPSKETQAMRTHLLKEPLQTVKRYENLRNDYQLRNEFPA